MSFSSRLYHTFDSILLLSHGRALYSGPGSFAPAEHFAKLPPGTVQSCPEGYNIADYLLEVASDPPVALFQMQNGSVTGNGMISKGGDNDASVDAEKGGLGPRRRGNGPALRRSESGSTYAATFLTQLQVLSGREWKVLKR
jgi:hypothetical protein